MFFRAFEFMQYFHVSNSFPSFTKIYSPVGIIVAHQNHLGSNFFICPSIDNFCGHTSTIFSSTILWLRLCSYSYWGLLQFTWLNPNQVTPPIKDPYDASEVLTEPISVFLRFRDTPRRWSDETSAKAAPKTPKPFAIWKELQRCIWWGGRASGEYHQRHCLLCHRRQKKLKPFETHMQNHKESLAARPASFPMYAPTKLHRRLHWAEAQPRPKTRHQALALRRLAYYTPQRKNFALTITGEEPEERARNQPPHAFTATTTTYQQIEP